VLIGLGNYVLYVMNRSVMGAVLFGSEAEIVVAEVGRWNRSWEESAEVAAVGDYCRVMGDGEADAVVAASKDVY
jgi:hypothetical protein